MNFAETIARTKKDEQTPVSSERAFPPAPFPRKYIRCVIDDLRSGVEAVLELRTAGFAPEDIHIWSCWDYEEVVIQQRQRQGSLAKMFTRMLSLIDTNMEDAYLDESRQGHHILAVRLSGSEQIEPARVLLAAHHAHLIKYVDTWAVADLPPAPEYSRAFNSAGFVEWKESEKPAEPVYTH
jgi:hypothetical protein